MKRRWQEDLNERLQELISKNKSPDEDLRSADWRYYLPLDSNHTALVIGSLYGTVPIELASICKEVHVLALSPESTTLLQLRKEQQEIANLHIHNGDLLQSFLGVGKTFNLVSIAAEATSFFDPSKLASLLKPAGVLHAFLPNRWNFEHLLHLEKGDAHSRTIFQYRRLLRKAGFGEISAFAPLPRHSGIPLFLLPLDDRRALEFFSKHLFPLFDAVSPTVKAQYGIPYRVAQIGIKCLPPTWVRSTIKIFSPGYMFFAKKNDAFTTL